jgi:PAS domain S-box-containing protein
MPVNPENNCEKEQEGHTSHPGPLQERPPPDSCDTLRQSEEKYHRVFDLANDGILLHTLTTKGIPGHFIDVNRMACRMLGYNREELLALGPTDIVPVELHPQLSDLVRRAASHDSFLFETRLMRKDGTTFPAESNSHLIQYDGKTVWISVIRDISERKAAENALRESEERFRDLFNNMGSGVAIYEPVDNGSDFVFRDINRAVETIDRVRKEDIIGQSVLRVFPGIKEFGLFDVFQRVARTGIAESHPVSVYKDKRILGWRENFVYRISSGEIVTIYEDVTEKKQAEEEVRLGREMLGIALRAAHAGTWDWDIATGTLIWSPEFLELFGLQPNVTPSFETWLAALHPDDREQAMEKINRSVSDHSALWNEYRIIFPGGDIRWVGAGGSATYSESGEPERMSGVCIDITPRKRAEDALRESEAHYKHLVENISDVIFTLDPQGTISYISPVISTLYGYSPDEVIGTYFGRFVHPDDLPLITDAFSRRDEGACSEITFRILTKDGTGRYVRVKETPLIVDGTTVGFNYIMTDITDRKQAEEALIESEEFNRGLVENLPDFIVIYDLKGIIRYANTAALDNIGIPASKIIGTYAPSYILGSRDGEIEEKMRQRLSGGTLSPYEIDIRASDNRTITAILRGSPITYMKEPCVLLVMTDITDRKRSEEALTESEKRYRTLFEESPVSLLDEDFSAVKSWIDAKFSEGVTDLATFFTEHPEDLKNCARMVKVEKINSSTRTMYGADSEEQFISGIDTVFTEDSYTTLKDEIVTFASGEPEFRGDSTTRKMNGQVMNILISCSIVPGYEATWKKVLISISNITDQIGTENALRQANKKLNLLSGITRHDILNQVAILEGYLDLAGEEVITPGLQDYMGHLDQAVKTIQHQIEFTREYQEIGVNAAAWQDIRDTIMTAARAFDRDDVALNITCSEVEIFADPLLQKVFYNLFDNAFRYAPPFSKITVSCNETGEGLLVVFADNGVGITAEDRKHLFERGFGKHTGLGLFLSREILAITGIRITENGEAGTGARFEITVPKGAYRFSGKALS